MRASLRAWSSSVHVHHDYGARGMLERGGALRFALGLEAWFELPEQGMREPELLARGSVFATPAAAGAGRALHLLAPAHVTHPWRYRGDFYAGPEHAWLDHVRPEAVEVRLTARALGSGALLLAAPLRAPRVHGEADLAVYGLADEEAALAALEARGAAVLPVPLAEPGRAGPGTPCVLVGNDQRGDQLVPVGINGRIEGHAGGAVVIDTGDTPSVLGMCGGSNMSGEGLRCAGPC